MPVCIYTYIASPIKFFSVPFIAKFYANLNKVFEYLEVVGHQPVEERLVAALQTRQERVLAEIARLRTHEHLRCTANASACTCEHCLRAHLPTVVAVRAHHLQLDRVHFRRQQPAQAEHVALPLAERRRWYKRQFFAIAAFARNVSAKSVLKICKGTLTFVQEGIGEHLAATRKDRHAHLTDAVRHKRRGRRSCNPIWDDTNIRALHK